MQDSTIPVSVWGGVHTLIGGYVLAVVIVLAPLGIFLSVPRRDPAAIPATVSLILAGLLCFSVLRIKAVVRIKERKPRHTLFERIRWIRKSPVYAGGTIIVRCPENDTAWRDGVTVGIEQADAVVVDLTSFSQNVLWELRSAVAMHPPSKILLLCSDEVIVDRQSLLDIVEPEGGAAAIVRCRWLVYPASLPRRGAEAAKQEFVEGLRRHLAACVISSVQRTVPPYTQPSS